MLKYIQSTRFLQNLKTINKEKAVTNTLLIFILKIFGIFASYVFTFVVTANFGASGWGNFSICMGIATFACLFGKVGFDTALLKFSSTLSQSKEDISILKNIYQKAFKRLLPLGILITILIVIGAPILSRIFFKDESNAWYFIIISISIIPTVFTLIDSEGLRGLGMTNRYVFLQNIAVYLISSVLLLFYIKITGSNKDFKSTLIVYVVAWIVVFLIGRMWWQKVVISADDIYNSIKVPSVKEIFNISYPMFWSNAMFVVINWTDTLMLGIFSTGAEVGIYNASFKISNLVTLPLFVITSIVAPKFANKHALGDTKGLSQVVTQSTLIIFLLTSPVFIVIAIFPSFFLNIFGSSFTTGVPILIILISGQFFKSFCGSTDYLLQLTGYEKIFQKIILSAMVINVLLNLILIPNFGGYGAAIGNACTIVYWNIVAIYYIKIKLNINALLNFKNLNLKHLKKMIVGE